MRHLVGHITRWIAWHTGSREAPGVTRAASITLLSSDR